MHQLIQWYGQRSPDMTSGYLKGRKYAWKLNPEDLEQYQKNRNQDILITDQWRW